MFVIYVFLLLYISININKYSIKKQIKYYLYLHHIK